MDMIVDDIDLAEQYQTRDEQGNITGNTLGSPAGVNSSEFFRKDIAVAIKSYTCRRWQGDFLSGGYL
jgi:hypothetical protein